MSDRELRTCYRLALTQPKDPETLWRYIAQLERLVGASSSPEPDQQLSLGMLLKAVLKKDLCNDICAIELRFDKEDYENYAEIILKKADEGPCGTLPEAVAALARDAGFDEWVEDDAPVEWEGQWGINRISAKGDQMGLLEEKDEEEEDEENTTRTWLGLERPPRFYWGWASECSRFYCWSLEEAVSRIQEYASQEKLKLTALKLRNQYYDD